MVRLPPDGSTTTAPNSSEVGAPRVWAERAGARASSAVPNIREASQLQPLRLTKPPPGRTRLFILRFGKLRATLEFHQARRACVFSRIRSFDGRYAASKGGLAGEKVSSAPTREMGASSQGKQASWTRAASSADGPEDRLASVS